MNVSGEVKTQIYDAIDLDGVHSGTLKYENIKHNDITPTWLENITAALVDKTYAWGTPATQVAFNDFNDKQAVSNDLWAYVGWDTGDGAYEWGNVTGLNKTAIVIQSEQNEYGLMRSNAAVVATNTATGGTLEFHGYLNGINTHDSHQVSIAHLEVISGYNGAGSGARTTIEAMATNHYQPSLNVNENETLKIEWTITFADDGV